MALNLIFSHNSSPFFPNTHSSLHRSFATTPLSFSLLPLSPPRNPRRIKSATVRLSSNKPPTSTGVNPADDDDETGGPEPPTVTDEWGEKSNLETEPLTKLSSSDPPKDDDEWGPDAAEQSKSFFVHGDGSAAVEDDGKLEALKRCLVDSVNGTGLGFSASAEKRAEVMEFVTQLEGANPTPAPTDAVELLDGNWVLLYTAFSELLPLLAVGTTPLLKIEKICQDINMSNLTIDNSINFSSPLATSTTIASANFEVQSPSRIQVEFKEGKFQPPKINSNVNLPKNLDVFGQNISLSPVEQLLNPLQEAVANIAGVISGQAPVKIPIPGDRTKSWLLITYLDKDLRISRGDGGIFVLAKEGSLLLNQ